MSDQTRPYDPRTFAARSGPGPNSRRLGVSNMRETNPFSTKVQHGSITKLAEVDKHEQERFQPCIKFVPVSDMKTFISTPPAKKTYKDLPGQGLCCTYGCVELALVPLGPSCRSVVAEPLQRMGGFGAGGRLQLQSKAGFVAVYVDIVASVYLPATLVAYISYYRTIADSLYGDSSTSARLTHLCFMLALRSFENWIVSLHQRFSSSSDTAMIDPSEFHNALNEAVSAFKPSVVRRMTEGESDLSVDCGSVNYEWPASLLLVKNAHASYLSSCFRVLTREGSPYLSKDSWIASEGRMPFYVSLSGCAKVSDLDALCQHASPRSGCYEFFPAYAFNGDLLAQDLTTEVRRTARTLVKLPVDYRHDDGFFESVDDQLNTSRILAMANILSSFSPEEPNPTAPLSSLRAEFASHLNFSGNKVMVASEVGEERSHAVASMGQQGDWMSSIMANMANRTSVCLGGARNGAFNPFAFLAQVTNADCISLSDLRSIFYADKLDGTHAAVARMEASKTACIAYKQGAIVELISIKESFDSTGFITLCGLWWAMKSCVLGPDYNLLPRFASMRHYMNSQLGNFNVESFDTLWEVDLPWKARLTIMSRFFYNLMKCCDVCVLNFEVLSQTDPKVFTYSDFRVVDDGTEDMAAVIALTASNADRASRLKRADEMSAAQLAHLSKSRHFLATAVLIGTDSVALVTKRPTMNIPLPSVLVKALPANAKSDFSNNVGIWSDFELKKRCNEGYVVGGLAFVGRDSGRDGGLATSKWKLPLVGVLSPYAVHTVSAEATLIYLGCKIDNDDEFPQISPESPLPLGGNRTQRFMAHAMAQDLQECLQVDGSKRMYLEFLAYCHAFAMRALNSPPGPILPLFGPCCDEAALFDATDTGCYEAVTYYMRQRMSQFFASLFIVGDGELSRILGDITVSSDNVDAFEELLLTMFLDGYAPFRPDPLAFIRCCNHDDFAETFAPIAIGNPPGLVSGTVTLTVRSIRAFSGETEGSISLLSASLSGPRALPNPTMWSKWAAQKSALPASAAANALTLVDDAKPAPSGRFLSRSGVPDAQGFVSLMAKLRLLSLSCLLVVPGLSPIGTHRSVAKGFKLQFRDNPNSLAVFYEVACSMGMHVTPFFNDVYDLGVYGDNQVRSPVTFDVFDAWKGEVLRLAHFSYDVHSFSPVFRIPQDGAYPDACDLIFSSFVANPTRDHAVALREVSFWVALPPVAVRLDSLLHGASVLDADILYINAQPKAGRFALFELFDRRIEADRPNDVTRITLLTLDRWFRTALQAVMHLLVGARMENGGYVVVLQHISLSVLVQHVQVAYSHSLADAILRILTPDLCDPQSNIRSSMIEIIRVTSVSGMITQARVLHWDEQVDYDSSPGSPASQFTVPVWRVIRYICESFHASRTGNVSYVPFIAAECGLEPPVAQDWDPKRDQFAEGFNARTALFDALASENAFGWLRDCLALMMSSGTGDVRSNNLFSTPSQFCHFSPSSSALATGYSTAVEFDPSIPPDECVLGTFDQAPFYLIDFSHTKTTSGPVKAQSLRLAVSGAIYDSSLVGTMASVRYATAPAPVVGDATEVDGCVQRFSIRKNFNTFGVAPVVRLSLGRNILHRVNLPALLSKRYDWAVSPVGFAGDWEASHSLHYNHFHLDALNDPSPGSDQFSTPLKAYKWGRNLAGRVPYDGLRRAGLVDKLPGGTDIDTAFLHCQNLSTDAVFYHVIDAFVCRGTSPANAMLFCVPLGKLTQRQIDTVSTIFCAVISCRDQTGNGELSVVADAASLFGQSLGRGAWCGPGGEEPPYPEFFVTDLGWIAVYKIPSGYTLRTPTIGRLHVERSALRGSAFFKRSVRDYAHYKRFTPGSLFVLSAPNSGPIQGIHKSRGIAMNIAANDADRLTASCALASAMCCGDVTQVGRISALTQLMDGASSTESVTTKVVQSVMGLNPALILLNAFGNWLLPVSMNTRVQEPDHLRLWCSFRFAHGFLRGDSAFSPGVIEEIPTADPHASADHIDLTKLRLGLDAQRGVAHPFKHSLRVRGGSSFGGSQHVRFSFVDRESIIMPVANVYVGAPYRTDLDFRVAVASHPIRIASGALVGPGLFDSVIVSGDKQCYFWVFVVLKTPSYKSPRARCFAIACTIEKNEHIDLYRVVARAMADHSPITRVLHWSINDTRHDLYKMSYVRFIQIITCDGALVVCSGRAWSGDTVSASLDSVCLRY